MDVYEQLMIKVLLEGCLMQNMPTKEERDESYFKLLKHIKDNYVITINHIRKQG